MTKAWEGGGGQSWISSVVTLHPSQINIPLSYTGNIPHDVTVMKKLSQKRRLTTYILNIGVNMRDVGSAVSPNLCNVFIYLFIVHLMTLSVAQTIERR
jgi:hypothetical protein